jgi:chorismate dehydratase
MRNDIIRISAVSYLNTLPFLYGIEHSKLLNNIEFSLDYPAICAKKLIDNQVDISLIPVASTPFVKNAYFISDYCIGAHNEVKSVLLLSETPLSQIKTVLLDYQSSTSVNLVRVLAARYWKISPEWIKAEKGFENSISGSTAAIVIGDRTFSLINQYKYVYDLSAEWYKFTRMPFVFATWAANKKIPTEFLDQFNHALKFGISHLKEVADKYHKENTNSKIDLYTYLADNISFLFNHEKKESLKLFYNYLFELQLIPEKPIHLLK